MLGAAGAAELIWCVLALREGILPPAINYQAPDPECDLDVVPNVARQSEGARGALQLVWLWRAQYDAGGEEVGRGE